MLDESTGGPPTLAIRGVSKAFGPTWALREVDLDLRAGEVHALVGENGAGKSTLMKVLSGAIRPDHGELRLDGRPYRPSGPREARASGVAMIYQELAIAPQLSVEANVLLGVEPSRGGFLRQRAGRRSVVEALKSLGHPEIRPERRAGSLSPGAQQIVEIARALISEARVLIFDEPTSSLTGRDADRLFETIRRLRERGLAIAYISHFLEEVVRVCDRYTVLRDGWVAESGAMAEATIPGLIVAMVGRELGELFPKVASRPGGPILKLSGLSGWRSPIGIDLTLHRGEILGVAGLVGVGRTELLRAIYGLDSVRSGKIQVADNRADPGAGPARRIAQGVGLLSEDRKGEGLALGRSIADNLAYPALAKFARAGFLRPGRLRKAAGGWLDRLGVKARGPGQSVAELSGGNQQKVALGRLLLQDADIFLLDEPTRGIDVGSKAEIYRLIGELASAGKGVLMVSSYLPELFGVCDRIAVLRRGELGAVKAVGDWTEAEVMGVATS